MFTNIAAMTLLDADKSLSFPAPDSALSPSYAATKGQEETINLGRAFADAARALRSLSLEQQRPVRIGLGGLSGVGKTQFAWGLKAELRGYDVIEKNCKRKQQYVWQHRTPSKGFIRYYDGYIMAYPELLPSYIKGDLSKFHMPLVDIVENPSADKHNKKFDCLVIMERAKQSGQSGQSGQNTTRHFAFVATKEIRDLLAYQKFLEDAQKFKAPAINPTAPRGAAPI